MLPESFSKGEAKRRWQQIWQRTKVHQHLRNLAQVLLQVGLESPSNEVHRGCWWKIRGAPKTTTRALSLIEALSWAAQVKYQHSAAKNWTARSFFPSRYFICNSNPSARCQRDMRAAAVIRPFQAGSFLRCSSLPIAPRIHLSASLWSTCLARENIDIFFTCCLQHWAGMPGKLILRNLFSSWSPTSLHPSHLLSGCFGQIKGSVAIAFAHRKPIAEASRNQDQSSTLWNPQCGQNN